MEESKKKLSPEDASATPVSEAPLNAEFDAEKADEILREVSAEDNERQLNKVTSLIVNGFSLFISLFLIYTAVFGAFDALRQRSICWPL